MPRPRAETPTFSLTLRKGHYYVSWWENGAAQRVSCRTGQLPAARRFLEEFKAGRAAPIIPECPTVGAILDAYREDRMRRPVGRAFSNLIDTIKAVLADLPADLLNKERVRHYLTERRAMGARGAIKRKPGDERTVSDASLRAELSLLRAGLKWAHRENWLATVPHIEMPPAGEPRQRWLTREEAQRLLDAALGAHLKLFIALGLYTGARSGAILELTWDRVNFERGVIDFGNGRGNKRRAVVPMHPKVRPLLEEAFAARKCAHVVEYRGARMARAVCGFRQTAQRAGLPGVTPHVLRHTAATWMAQRGVSVDRIAAYLGNSPFIIERVYAHHTPEYMLDAVQALGD